jgi:alkaline phosphatase D
MKRCIAISIPVSLALAGAGCSASGDDPAPVTAQQSVTSAPQITHGPMLGDVRSQRARIWLRLDGAGVVKVRVKPAGGSFGASSLGFATGSDNTVIVPLNGLTASTDYSYQLTTDDGASWTSTYKLRTTPPDTAAASFSFVVLTDFQARSAPALTRALGDQPDFGILLGDLDHRGPGKPDGDGDPSNDAAHYLAAMRTMRQELRSATTGFGADFIGSAAAPGFIVNSLRQIPMYYGWDDHDYCDNNADYSCAARPQAFTVLQEYFIPGRDGDFSSSGGSYQRIKYGKDVEIFILDGRSWRNNPAGSMLGNAQKLWLKDGLLAAQQADVKMKFVLSPVPFNRTTKLWDAWGLFSTERKELVDYVQGNGITGVTIISGDIHSGGAFDDGTNSDFPEISSPQTNMGTFVNTFLRGDDTPQAHWTHGETDNGWPNDGTDLPGYTRVDVDGATRKATITVRNTDGTVRVAHCGHALSYTTP